MKDKSIYSKSCELKNILNDAMANLKNVIDINTIVGEPIVQVDGTIIVPVSKVYVGIVSGGGEINKKNPSNCNPNYPFAGGNGAGFTISPVGFLITKKGVTNFVPVSIDNSESKLYDILGSALKIVTENLKKDKVQK